jgi:hypothetical protein
VEALPTLADLFTTFAEPHLPVDPQVQETVWSQKINEGRATEIDYLMHVNGMSREEALAKYEEILEFQAFKAAKLKALNAVLAQPAAQEEDSQEDK